MELLSNMRAPPRLAQEARTKDPNSVVRTNVYGPSQDIVSGERFPPGSLNKSDVRYWHLADMLSGSLNVRFQK